MIRQIIKIDAEKCNGCGLCVSACHEDAIGLVNGKAALLRDDYCDGLGNCLPVCPTDAISFVAREAKAFDEQAVKLAQAEKATQDTPHGCPGTRAKVIGRTDTQIKSQEAYVPTLPSQLNQWPCQLKLVPPNATYFNNAHLLIAADCAAFAYGNFHSEFMKNKITLIGCPKLDDIDYSQKLTSIINMNNIKSITVVRMEVPCCGGIVNAVMQALKDSTKMIPWSVVTISTDGHILKD